MRLMMRWSLNTNKTDDEMKLGLRRYSEVKV